MLEEFGATVHVTQKLGKSSEYFYSHHRQTAYYHPATFFACDQLAFVQDPLETFNTLMLMPIDLALAELKRPTHRWAVAKWLANQPKR
ncbi:Putative hydrolase [Lacticaseibacillus paracasei]|nr:Putative hydrolase [Lacticaseibacillus paracasei]AEA58249.1 Putative hydrolase [Lacticaseibacillus paracasei]CCK23632.1 NUDIX family hydrolase [Lacticaseibacillus paracasei]